MLGFALGSVRVTIMPHLRVLRAGGPDLLAVHDPVVAVAHRGACAGPARSEPAAGSLKSWHQISSPRSMRLEVARFCSVGAVRHDRRPEHALADAEHVRRNVEASPLPDSRSRSGSACAPRPPYSFGQVMQAQPRVGLACLPRLARARSRLAARRRLSRAGSSASPGVEPRCDCVEPGTRAPRARNAASSGVSLKSMRCSYAAVAGAVDHELVAPVAPAFRATTREQLRAPIEEVAVVLPGVADAAVHLDHLLAGQLERLAGGDARAAGCGGRARRRRSRAPRRRSRRSTSRARSRRRGRPCGA